MPSMRRMVALSVVALSIFGSGCTLVSDATSLTVFEMRECLQDHLESARNRKWAARAWEEVEACNPQRGYSADYAQGFKDGFESYLFRGGNGEPPAFPPRNYRQVRYQTPQGYQAIEDWFAGFRHGATAARESGQRRWITGPSALANPGPPLVAAPAPVEAESVEPALAKPWFDFKFKMAAPDWLKRWRSDS
jgi:hypothetical protein